MKTFLVSDTHFGHPNIIKFTKPDGSLLRPGFTNIQEHDEFLIQRWNSVVGPEDKVYHLGDVGFKNWNYMDRILSRLNGTKVLIKGNHDVHKLSQYQQYFKDVRAYHVLDRCVLSHVPIHPYSLDRWNINLHGHLHENELPDKKYMNVCVEKTDFAPIDFELIKRRINEQTLREHYYG